MERARGGEGTALRPLRAAAEARAALRGGSRDAGALLRLAAAVEASLRRLLRDDPYAPLEVRLRALAPDEIPADELLAELRRRDRISLELAAAFHELNGARRRVAGGAPPAAQDAELALRVADRLEMEAVAPPPPPVPLPEEPVLTEDETRVHPVPPATRNPTGARLWALLAMLGLLLLAGVLFWRERRADAELDRGIAAYRQGRPAAAVEHFRRYAEHEPEDPAPRVYLARIHRRAGRLEEAREELQRGLREAPEDPALHREMGFLLLNAGRPDAAVPRFRDALRLDPQSTEGWLGLVRALRASGREDAIPRVLASAPPEVRALVGNGRSAAPLPVP
jgi:tetratricopeptide (TPR) repeat protein